MNFAEIDAVSNSLRIQGFDSYHTLMCLSLIHAKIQINFGEKACITENFIEQRGQLELLFQIWHLY